MAETLDPAAQQDPPQRIAVVADVCFYREGLVACLSDNGTFAVVGTAADAAAALRLAAEVRPEIVLVDMTMPDALGAARSLARAHADARIVALGVPETETAVIGCAEAGVSAYVAHDASLADLKGTLIRLGRGEATCSPRIAAGLMRRVAALAADRPDDRPRSPLTSREEEIVVLIDEGLSNKEIARRLFIEVATVKNHVHNILEKLGVGRRNDAAARMRTVGYSSRRVLDMRGRGEA